MSNEVIDYGSVCSGIEAASVAWQQLGWRPAWFAEIEAFPCAVLAHHHPEVANHGDMTSLPSKVLKGHVSAPAVLVGGTPCQAFSVAGMRRGLEDPRGRLTIKFVELADAIDHVRTARGDTECVVVWENVPGVLSDKENAFGCFLAALVGESEPLEPPGGGGTDAGCVYGPKRATARRCRLPEIVPEVRAGVPAPLQLTPWKIGALRVLAELELDGYVTAKSVREHGVDARRFCASDGWLQSLGGGRWGKGTIPAFDQQHPAAYAQVLAEAMEVRKVTA